MAGMRFLPVSAARAADCVGHRPHLPARWPGAAPPEASHAAQDRLAPALVEGCLQEPLLQGAAPAACKYLFSAFCGIAVIHTACMLLTV